MFVISVNPGNLIQRAVQANMNSGGKVELDMHAPPTIRKMWIPAGGILLITSKLLRNYLQRSSFAVGSSKLLPNYCGISSSAVVSQ